MQTDYRVILVSQGIMAFFVCNSTRFCAVIDDPWYDTYNPMYWLYRFLGTQSSITTYICTGGFEFEFEFLFT